MTLAGKDVNVESVQAELDALEKDYKRRGTVLRALLKVLKAEEEEPAEEPVTD